MVKIGAVSRLLLLASSASAFVGNTELTRPNVVGRDVMGGRDIRGHTNLRRDGEGYGRPLAAPVKLLERIPQPTNFPDVGSGTVSVLHEPRISIPTEQPDSTYSLHRRDGDEEDAKAPPAVAAPPAPAPPAPPAQTTIGPIASSVSASLTSSAASALASVSASFQGQLSSLSSQSSAAVAAASAAASSSIASVSASAASAIAAASASASSAVASANSATASLAASASSAGAAAASSSAAVAVQASLVTQVSDTMPSATSGVSNNNLVQPNSSGTSSEAGTLLVTPSQIAAIVIGTIVGTAILTLSVVYSVSVCRNKREKKFQERYNRENKYNDHIALNPVSHDDEAGRAEGYSSRDEKQRANWSVESTPNVPSAQKAMPQKSRPSLPPLPEESPRVSDQFNLYPPGEGSSGNSDYRATNFTPSQSAFAMPEEPEPVKLALMKRRSKGGSQRLAVARVGSISQQGGVGVKENTNASGYTNPYFSVPSTAGQEQFQRPALVRTPSSDTLPHPNSAIASPLRLNPLLSTSTAPRTSGFTWGSWGPESPSRVPPSTTQYQNLNAQVQPDYQNSQNPPSTKPQYVPDRSYNHVGFLLQHNSVSPRPPQQAQMPGPNSRPGNTSQEQAPNSLISSPKPLRPGNHLSVSPVSPYSSTFENPLGSPVHYVSHLSPPPKSPLRAAVRQSKSDYSLRDYNVSPESSNGEGSSNKATPPLPLRRFSRSSGELGAIGLAQATAGLDLNIGPGGSAFSFTATGPTPPRLTPTNTNGTAASGGVSRTSSQTAKSTNTNTNPNGGGRFTFLSSSEHSPESNRSGTPTNPWGSLPVLQRRRSSSLGRVEIPPEQLTNGGIYVGAPGPRFTLFPRTDGGGGGTIAAAAPLSPMGHGKSLSTGTVDYRQWDRDGMGLRVVNM